MNQYSPLHSSIRKGGAPFKIPDRGGSQKCHAGESAATVSISQHCAGNHKGPNRNLDFTLQLAGARTLVRSIIGTKNPSCIILVS
jgi:hypothetical protein